MNQQLEFFQDKGYLSKTGSKVRDNLNFSDTSIKRTVLSKGLPCFTGGFWTSKQRKANRIHELSYRACFKPQLPAFFIELFTQPGDVVYDPFMGRGTTVIEAVLRGRIPYGNDINPLSQVLTEPRIQPPHLNQIYDRLNEIPWSKFKNIKNKKLLTFYHPKTLAQVEGLRTWLNRRRQRAVLDKTDRWIQMVAVNRLTGHSSGFFSIYTMPPNQAVSLDRQKKINKKRGQKATFRDVPNLIAKKSASLLSQMTVLDKDSKYLLLTKPAHKTSQIPSHSVNLVVTSPPFLDTVDYTTDNWLRCWFLGIDVKSIPISQYRNIDRWSAFVRKTLKELARVTRLKGYIAFEVGEVRKGAIQLEKYVLQEIKGLPLKAVALLINEQKFTKTANCWGVSNNKSGTNSNRIVLLKRI